MIPSRAVAVVARLRPMNLRVSFKIVVTGDSQTEEPPTYVTEDEVKDMIDAALENSNSGNDDGGCGFFRFQLCGACGRARCHNGGRCGYYDEKRRKDTTNKQVN